MKFWFTGAGEASDSFTFQVDKATAEADVLILAAYRLHGHVELPGLHG